MGELNAESPAPDITPQPAPPHTPEARREIVTSRPAPDTCGPPPYSRSPLDEPERPAAPLPWGAPPNLLPGYAPLAPPYPMYPGAPMPFMPYPLFRPVEPPKGLATTSMVLGICALPLSLFCSYANFIGALLGLIAVIMAAAALAKCRKRTAGGKGMAIAGLVTGICALCIGVFITVLLFTLISSMAP